MKNYLRNSGYSNFERFFNFSKFESPKGIICLIQTTEKNFGCVEHSLIEGEESIFLKNRDKTPYQILGWSQQEFVREIGGDEWECDLLSGDEVAGDKAYSFEEWAEKVYRHIASEYGAIEFDFVVDKTKSFSEIPMDYPEVSKKIDLKKL